MEFTRVAFPKSLAVREEGIGHETAIGNEAPLGLRNVMRSLELEPNRVLVVCGLYNYEIERAREVDVRRFFVLHKD